MRIVGEWPQLVEPTCGARRRDAVVRPVHHRLATRVLRQDLDRQFADGRIVILQGSHYLVGMLGIKSVECPVGASPMHRLPFGRHAGQRRSRLLGMRDQPSASGKLTRAVRRAKRVQGVLEGLGRLRGSSRTESDRSDMIDAARFLVADAIAPDSRIIPVAQVDRPVGSDIQIDGAEPRVVSFEPHVIVGPKGGSVRSEGEEVDLSRSRVDFQDGGRTREGKQGSFVGEQTARGTVSRTDDLGNDPRHLFRVVESGSRHAVPEIRTWKNPSDAASLMAIIVVVGKEAASEAVNADFIVVAQAVGEHFHLRAIGAHAADRAIPSTLQTPSRAVGDLERRLIGSVVVHPVTGVSHSEVEPTIDTQLQTVQAVVAVDAAKAGQQRLAMVRSVVSVAVFQNEQVRGVADEDSTTSIDAALPMLLEGQPHRHRKDILGKDRHLVGSAVSVGILKHLDLIGARDTLKLALLRPGPKAIIESLGNPNATARIDH